MRLKREYTCFSSGRERRDALLSTTHIVHSEHPELVLSVRAARIRLKMSFFASNIPEATDVVEVGDGPADLLVVPGGGLRLVLDDVVLDITRYVPVIRPGESHRGGLDIGNPHVGRGLWQGWGGNSGQSFQPAGSESETMLICFMNLFVFTLLTT